MHEGVVYLLPEPEATAAAAAAAAAAACGPLHRRWQSHACSVLLRAPQLMQRTRSRRL
jgi:hypothetical protein